MLRIRVKNLEDGREEVLEIEGDEATIGRHPRSDIVIRDGRVSTRHARILRGLVIVDVGSTNGTFVGDERVDGARLVGDGPVRLGQEVEIEVLPDAPEDAVDEPENAGELNPATIAIEDPGPKAEPTSSSNGAASGEVERLTAANRKLRAQVARLESRVRQAYAIAAKDLLRRRAHELDAQRADLATEIEHLDADLDRDA